MGQAEVKKYTTFKIGGDAKALYFPKSVGEFVELLKTIKKPLILGNGSNILVSSEGVDEEIIFTTGICNVEIKDNKVKAECGVKGQALSKEAQNKSLSGFEFMIGIPGTIGGMVYMNAGAHNQQISDSFVSCEIFDLKSQKTVVLDKDKMKFDYRTSALKNNNYIMLCAEFELHGEEQAKIDNIIERNIEFRKKHQPSLSLPNAGSIFKNPIGDSAGRLLDQAGVKSLSVGGARVYEEHANFIINSADATSLDVSRLMLNMQNMVKNRYNIKLEPEIKYIGRKTKEEEQIWQELLSN